MAEDKPDRFAAGSGGGETDAAERDDFRPGVTGGGQNYLPTGGQTSGASDAEGTIGAVGEMDFTGSPAGTAGASPAGATEGGGPGGGAKSGGGTGPADAGQ